MKYTDSCMVAFVIKNNKSLCLEEQGGVTKGYLLLSCNFLFCVGLFLYLQLLLYFLILAELIKGSLSAALGLAFIVLLDGL